MAKVSYEIADYVESTLKPPADDKPGRKTILLYGETGMGKTHSIITLPDQCWPVLYLDIDDNANKLIRQCREGQKELYRVRPPRWLPDSRDKMQAVGMQFLRDIVSAAHTGAFPGDGQTPIRTIVLDSVSMFYPVVMDAAMATAGKSRDTTPSQPDYGVAKRAVENFLEVLKETDFHIIVTAHESVREDEVSRAFRGSPALTGQLATTFPRYFQEILYCFTQGKKDEVEWRWATRPKGIYVARSLEIDELECPQDFGKIFDGGT